METDNATGQAHLKALLLEQFIIQEQVKALFQKILRRISIIYISLSVAILVGMMFIIYIVSRPEPMSSFREKVLFQGQRIDTNGQYIKSNRTILNEIKSEIKGGKTKNSIKNN